MALSFNGSSQYVSRTANLPAFSGFTICGWTIQASDPNANVGICGLNNSGDTGVNLLTQSDGTTLNIWNGSSDTGFSSSPSVGTAYFFALTGDASGIVGYWRALGSNTFTTLSVSNATSGSPSNMHLGTYFTSFAQFMYPGRFWNVKIWDRKLTSAELMVESFYARPMYPASINLWWKLKNATDTADYSGNARTATFFNTPTVSDDTVNLWATRRRIFTSAAAVTNDIAAVGSLSITGAADLDALGSLSAAGALSISGVADLDAQGSLVAAGALSITGAADLDARGSLVAAGALSITGAADLDATGSLVAAGSVAISGSASLTGSLNDISAAGAISISGVADLDAIGSLAAAGALSIAGIADLDATGSLTAAGSLSITGAADLAGVLASDMSAVGSLSISGAASLTAIGQLIASGEIRITGVASLAGATAIPSSDQTVTVSGPLTATVHGPFTSTVNG